MTDTFLEDYFKNLGIQSVFIAHTDASPSFFRVQSKVDLQEFDNAVRRVKKDNCLLLEMGSGQIGELDNQRDTCRIGLHVLIKTSTKFEEIKAARALAKYILLSMISIMRRDIKPIYLFSDLAAGPLNAAGITFDSNCKYDDMDGIDGNWYGKVMYFDFKAPVNVAYNADDWIVPVL